jgi:anti-anti-sigma factor
MNTGDHPGKVLHASHEGVCVLRFLGEIRHPLGPALECFLEELVRTKPEGLVIDLGETRIIDSTCLGLLARAALQFRAQGLPIPTVVSPVADITEVLRSMSFDRLFNIVGEMPIALMDTRVLSPSGSSNPDALLATMLGAHRTLMGLSEQNRLQFKDVVEALERESAARRDGSERCRA